MLLIFAKEAAQNINTAANQPNILGELKLCNNTKNSNDKTKMTD